MKYSYRSFWLIMIAIFLSASHIRAQEIEWQNTIGGDQFDNLSTIKQTTDGGYILGGYSTSGISGDKTENTNGGMDYWIVKTDSSGNIEWQNTIGGDDMDRLYSMQQTTDGGFILGGYSFSNISGDKTENSNGQSDYWIVKTDSTGNIQWQNTIGGNTYDELFSIIQTTDGGYLLGGRSYSSISGDKTENSNGVYDYWIVKTDATGNIQWQNTIGGNSDDYLYSMQQTTDGGFILGGYSFSNISGDKTENSLGTSDYWLVKTDSSGNIQWQNTIGGGLTDELYSVQQTTDGGYILAGASRSNISSDKTENCFGLQDFWLVKTDSTGIILWQKTFGGNEIDQPSSVQQTFDGGYIVCGWSESNISVNKTENSFGVSDYWIIKTDVSGNIQWQNTIGGSDFDYISSIQQTTGSGYILGGWSPSNISGEKTENTNGEDDFWIIKITDKYNLITGNVFADLNSNNVWDASDQSLINKKITEQNTGRFAFSHTNGNYSVAVLDSGNFIVDSPTTNFYTTVPITHSSYFPGILQTDSLNDFAFQPAGAFNDLCVSITPLDPFRAGFDANYMITYENVGTTTLNPTVIFFPDDNVSFNSSSPVASTVTLDSIVWNFGPLSPFQQGSILVTVNVNTGIPIGTLINSGVVVGPIAGDANTICNYSYWEVFTTGSFDPNDILVDEDTLTTTQLSTNPYLEYIIRFQNTGNDTAFTVKILNPIDTNKLELSSIEFVNSSHTVNLNWIPWERNMEFMFSNIMLPDSNTNEPLSHGFVRYRIKPKTILSAGDSISNSAGIYFDFNAPVLTNNAITKIVLPTSLDSPGQVFDFTMYPNPSINDVTLNFFLKRNSSVEINLTDALGKLLHIEKQNLHAGRNSLKISSADLPPGVYFVKLIVDGDVCIKKLMKI